ncbi:hypothetical protein PR048_016867 [Dryococelus australis]|uniref:ERC protein 2 n=1 Tax=Dryococelus australis TaxID=614101 RepID=A0ABQ9H7W3_9NEOP|nr:hypothetical protein PR048_016867 [Dryococelus australis]
MSRDPYAASSLSGSRSPRGARRGELPTVDRSPSRAYPRGSPVGGRKAGGRPSRSGNTSPDHAGGGYYGGGGQHHMGSPYYRDEELGSPVMMDDRGRSLGGGGGHHRSRSASRPAASAGGGAVSSRYQSLDRATAGDPDREFMPIREPRERSLDRGGRDRSLERGGGGMYAEDELYGGGRSARQSPNPHLMAAGGRDPANSYISELQQQNNDLQRELGNFKRELELTNQKLGSSMHSIKTFWSPELKKERALRKEESAKYSLINDQLKLLNSENQVSSLDYF